MEKWQLQDAKARFSELVKHAIADGPQVVTVHGHPEVIVLSISAFNKLSKQKTSLVAFFQKSPLRELQLELKRDKSEPRDISL